MMLIYGECNKNASAFIQTINIFPKTFRFFTILFNQTNDVYVKIYEAAQLLCFMFFKYKTNMYIHFKFANVLWVAFSIPSGSLSLVKYPVYN
jgi:hypothetical protein